MKSSSSFGGSSNNDMSKELYNQRTASFNSINRLALEPLSMMTYLGFGYGGICQYLWALLFGFFMTPFLIQVAGISPFAAGTLQLFASVWSASINPVVGYLSDHSPFPRRLSWIVGATIPFCYFFFLFWLVPPFFSTNELIAYYTIVYIICASAFMCYIVAYNAMSAELTPNYDERTKLSGYRWFFSLVVGTVAVGVQSFLIFSFKNSTGGVDLQRGYAVAGAVMALFLLTPGLILMLTIHERRYVPLKSRITKLTSIKTLFNRPFITVIIVNSCGWAALTFLTNNLVLYVTYVIQEEKLFPFVLVIVLGVCSFGLLAWTALSMKVGKKLVYFIGTFIMMAAIFPTTFLGANSVVLILILPAFGGLGLGVLYLIPYSMIPDVIEYDELKTGERREGVYFSIFIFFEKIATGVGLAISSYYLGAVGYNASNATQSDDVILALRLLVGTFPCIILLVSWIACFLYPITKKKHQQLLNQLESIRRLNMEQENYIQQPVGSIEKYLDDDWE